MNDRHGTGQSVSDQMPLQSLFHCDIEDQVLLSCHLLGKITSTQILRAHSDDISTIQNARLMMDRLSRKREPMLKKIKPLDIEMVVKNLPHVHLDTVRSRRHLQSVFGIPFRRPPVTPSRDWRFLRHDVEMVDELISFQLTAKRCQVSFGYASHFEAEGHPVFPVVEVTDGELIHRMRPQPDKTLIVGDHHVVFEKDSGEETITLGNIIRDATIARKFLVYDQLERMESLNRRAWGKRIYAFTIAGRKGTKTSSRKRLKSCIDAIPETVNPHRFFFVDRQSLLEAGDDISELTWIRGDGQAMKLPCWR